MIDLIIPLTLTIIAANSAIIPDKFLRTGREFSSRSFPIDINEMPCQVSLKGIKGEFICGGALINKNWVLTAAHCLKLREPKFVHMGSSNKIEGGINVKIIGNFTHPKYQQSAYHDYDFGLLELADYNNTGLVISFPILPEENEKIKDGALLRVSGWGETLCPSYDPNLLRSITIPKISQEECVRIYEKEITDQMFCAGYKKNGPATCEGDSGGPLLLGNKIVGVVSWGESCEESSYGVYAKVSTVRKWIKEITGI